MDAAAVPPKEFICPLTKELMVDPVVSRYGVNFERKAIMTWLMAGNTFCPVTGNRLRPSCLVSDKALEWKIRSWLHQHDQEVPELDDKDDEDILRGFVGTIAITPQKYICPLTKKLMKEPMMCCNGVNFERKAILKYIDEHSDTCPVTGKPLFPQNLVPNNALKREIRQWKASNGDHGEDLPVLHLEPVCAPHHMAIHKLKDACIGIRGDEAVERMRARHSERLRKSGLLHLLGDQHKGGVCLEEPFSATLVLDETLDTLQSLGHIY